MVHEPTILVHEDGSNAAARPVGRCRVARHRARPAKNLARRSACRGCSRPRTTRAAPFPPAGAHRRRNRLVDSTTTDVGSSAKPHRPLDQPLTNRESEALSFHDPRFSHGSAARFITTTGVCDRTTPYDAFFYGGFGVDNNHIFSHVRLHMEVSLQPSATAARTHCTATPALAVALCLSIRCHLQDAAILAR